MARGAKPAATAKKSSIKATSLKLQAATAAMGARVVNHDLLYLDNHSIKCADSSKYMSGLECPSYRPLGTYSGAGCIVDISGEISHGRVIVFEDSGDEVTRRPL
jgi:hypothetical protein